MAGIHITLLLQGVDTSTHVLECCPLRHSLLMACQRSFTSITEKKLSGIVCMCNLTMCAAHETMHAMTCARHNRHVAVGSETQQT